MTAQLYKFTKMTESLLRGAFSAMSIRPRQSWWKKKIISVSPSTWTPLPKTNMTATKNPSSREGGKFLKKWSLCSQCRVWRKGERIFLVESSFPKYILERSEYNSRENVKRKLLPEVWSSKDTILQALYHFGSFFNQLGKLKKYKCKQWKTVPHLLGNQEFILGLVLSQV